MSQFDKPPKPSRSSSQSLSRGSSRIKSTRTTIKETDQNIDKTTSNTSSDNEGSTPKTIHRQQSKRRTEKNSDTEIQIEKAKSPRKSKRSVSRTSSSKPDKKKSNKIELKSPTTGEKITLAAEDFIDNVDDLSIQNDELEDSKRPILQQESNPNLFGVPSYQEILPKPENDIEVIFVPDGLNYKQINHLNTKYTTIGEKPLGLTWETKVAQFIHSYTNKFTPLYRFCQALYAGMCLLTLLLLPTNTYSILSNQQVPVLEINELFINQTVLFIQPDSSVGNQSYDHFNLFSFIMYYSTYASSFSYFFQLMSLINVIGSLRLLEKGRDPSVSYTRDNIIRFLLSWMSCIFSFCSYLSTVVMIYIDVNLNLSQTSEYGGSFGMPNWMFVLDNLVHSDTIGPISEWIIFNSIRGWMGLLGYLICQFVLNYTFLDVAQNHQQKSFTTLLENDKEENLKIP